MSASILKRLEIVARAAARVTTRTVARTVAHVSEIWEESREAFLKELDPDIEDARILREERRPAPDQEA